MEQYRPHPEQNQPSGEGRADYSAMLSSIRADQDRETFLTDLRRNQEQLLSLAQELMHNQGNTPEERRAYVSAGGYLDIVLKQYIFDIDPFVSSKHPNNEGFYLERQAVGHDFLQSAVFQWYDKHPDSQAAREVAIMGLFADPAKHHELLQEMWPSLRAVAMHSQLHKKK